MGFHRLYKLYQRIRKGGRYHLGGKISVCNLLLFNLVLNVFESLRRRSTSEGSDSSLSEYSDVVTLDFSCHKVIRKYQRGELIGTYCKTSSLVSNASWLQTYISCPVGESKKGSRVYAGMDCNSGSLVAISEWNFPIGKRDKKGRLIKEVGGGEGHSLSYDAVLKQVES